MFAVLDLSLLLNGAGAALTVASNLMKRMGRLRVFAVGANAAFLMQAAVEASALACALQAALLSINAWRLWSLRRMVKALEAATRDAPVGEWLLPQMKKEVLKAGSVLFRKGSPADSLYFVESGRTRAVELGESLEPGRLIGEIGLFSEHHTRPVTVVCETDCTVHSMSDEAVHLLFVQNPTIAFYLTKLLVRQLRSELDRRCLAR